jgi:hypothetical protein
MHNMSLRRIFSAGVAFALFAGLALSVVSPKAFGQDDAATRRGRRKYKAPPEVSHIEVTVIKGFNKKPIVNAAVVFHPTMNGKDEGNLEVKTDPEGKAIIDVIPTGSTMTVQVIADGFATFAQDYIVKDPSQAIVITMIRPQAQISKYEENHGKASDRKAGVQEPEKGATPPVIQTPKPTNHTSDPSPSAPVTPAPPQL